MKKIVLISTLLLSAACGQRAKEEAIVGLTTSNDSLNYILHKRDSVINDALTTISDIASSLESVKRAEGMIVEAVEIGKSDKDQIREDLELLSTLISTNKEKIASLQRFVLALRKENINMDGLTKLVEQLSEQLMAKDSTISSMLANIDNLHEQIELLNSSVEQLEGDNISLSEDLITTNNALNEAYYIVGREKSLLDEGIIIKKGFISKTILANPNIDKGDLIKIDIRSVDRIDIKGSKVEVVGSFDPDSYELLEGGGNRIVDALLIKDKQEFWRNGRILIITYK